MTFFHSLSTHTLAESYVYVGNCDSSGHAHINLDVNKVLGMGVDATAHLVTHQYAMHKLTKSCIDLSVKSGEYK